MIPCISSTFPPKIFCPLHWQRCYRNYECGSVVKKFYQGFVNSGFLAKIKKKVMAAAEHLESRLSQLTQEEDMAEDSPVVSDWLYSLIHSLSHPLTQSFVHSFTCLITCFVTHLHIHIYEPSVHSLWQVRELGERVNLVRGMCGWLEETRLYEPGVYLPALPPHLLPHRLTSIFQVRMLFIFISVLFWRGVLVFSPFCHS